MSAVHDIYTSLAFKANHPLSHLLSSFTVEIIVIAVCLLILVPLARFLFYLFTQTDSYSKLSGQTGSVKVSQLPNLAATIPWIGHLIGLQNNSARYINRLIFSTASPIFTINIPFKRIIVANPSLDRHLSRHVNDTGLAQILAYVGPRVFSLGERTIQVILDAEPRPLHKVEFGSVDSLRALTERSSSFLWDEMDKMPAVNHVHLAHWMFKATVSATANAVWGTKNPWRMDGEFAEEFMNLSETFDSLSRPFPRLTARSAFQSRKFLNTRLQAFHAEHRESRVQSVAHGINVVAQADPDWESNPDYFNIEMVSALGLLATPSTLSVWLMRHLLATPDLLRVIIDEVHRLGVLPADERCGYT
ncbi:hypothetical protein G7046_g9394 [Stylonectria norvegica]|nr:hypothetical protein G7046_g9394 [Stylonectria norvegica]